MMSIRVVFMVAFLVLSAGCASTGGNTSVEGAVAPGSGTMDLYREGMQAYSEGRLDVAESRLTELLEKVPEDAQVWFRLGNIYARTNRPRQAVQAYQDALMRNPELAKAWHNMGVVRLRQAANDFVSLARSVPAEDPLHARGMKMSNTILALLNELPDNSNVEVNIDLKEPVQSNEVDQPTAGDEGTGPGRER